MQFGSIPGKGQVAGTRQIERIVRKKILGKLDAVKGDVHKAYPSTTIACVITLLKRDISQKEQKADLVHRCCDRKLSGRCAADWWILLNIGFQLRYELCSPIPASRLTAAEKNLAVHVTHDGVRIVLVIALYIGFGGSSTSVFEFEKSDSKLVSWYQLALLAVDANAKTS